LKVDTLLYVDQAYNSEAVNESDDSDYVEHYRMKIHVVHAHTYLQQKQNAADHISDRMYTRHS